MKKRQNGLNIVGVLLIVFVLINAWVPDVLAGERYPGFSNGVTVGAARFFDGDLGIGLSGRVFLEYAPYIHEIGLRLTGGYLHFADTITIGTPPFSSKEDVIVDDMYATAGIIYRFSRGKFVPFLTGGLGLYRYHKEDVYPAPGPIIGGVQASITDVVKEKKGNDFGFNLGGGIEYFMNNRTSLSLEMLMHSIYGEMNSEIFDITVVFRFLPQ